MNITSSLLNEQRKRGYVLISNEQEKERQNFPNPSSSPNDQQKNQIKMIKIRFFIQRMRVCVVDTIFTN
ncbi:hypothetical protein BpHYR1_035176 [Brachionus plicatilis]|uniref:Uncharacterized protein n=1 Tax=Brachionus plicatilis TaxID=10195 RepID=A0A3M7SG20_BRAPC|nr:hypothetical protein BpHYR1_035176 [Brachionus plicatilis]